MEQWPCIGMSLRGAGLGSSWLQRRPRFLGLGAWRRWAIAFHSPHRGDDGRELRNVRYEHLLQR
eukprot:4968256-Heterocapsa_arctica.AAC.1